MYNDQGPLLSICIPTYNRGEVVVDRVRRILEYEGYNIEIIILDNCSTDSSFADIKELKDSRVKLYRNVTNIPASINWIETLKYATGKYIIHLNDRDYLEGKELKNFLRILEKNEIGAGYCNYSDSCHQQLYCGAQAKAQVKFAGYHPTGVLLNNEIVSDLDLNKYQSKVVFDKPDVMPHIELMYDLCKYGAWISYSSGLVHNANDNFLSQSSGVVFNSEKKKLDGKFWFQPEYIFQDFLGVLPAIVNDDCMGKEEKEMVLNSAISKVLKACTVNYGMALISNINLVHYNLYRSKFDWFVLEKILVDYSKKLQDEIKHYGDFNIAITKIRLWILLKIQKFKFHYLMAILDNNKKYRIESKGFDER